MLCIRRQRCFLVVTWVQICLYLQCYITYVRITVISGLSSYMLVYMNEKEQPIQMQDRFVIICLFVLCTHFYYSYMYTRVEKAGRRRYQRIDWSQNLRREWRYCGNHYQQNISWCNSYIHWMYLWTHGLTLNTFCKLMALNWFPKSCIHSPIHLLTIFFIHIFLHCTL